MNQTEGTDISSSSPFNFRRWRAAWKQPASVTASLAPALYGLVGSSWLLSTTPGACWSIATTTPCECWASPTQPPERQSWRAPVATARTSELLTWFTWKSPPASAGPRATPRVQAAAPVPKTPAVRTCAADGVITQPCTSPACLATAKCAGAAMWSVRHAWGRRRCTPAKTRNRGRDRRNVSEKHKHKKYARTHRRSGAGSPIPSLSLQNSRQVFVGEGYACVMLYHCC